MTPARIHALGIERCNALEAMWGIVLYWEIILLWHIVLPSESYIGSIGSMDFPNLNRGDVQSPVPDPRVRGIVQLYWTFFISPRKSCYSCYKISEDGWFLSARFQSQVHQVLDQKLELYP